MKIKSQLVTQMSGSIGGVVGSHNKGGMYLRARSIPTNPQSAAQANVRNAMSSLVTRWNDTLTAGQRDAWEVYAANVPKTNSLGDSILLSGQQWYLACNVPRLRALNSGISALSTIAVVDAAPTTFSRATLSPVSLPDVSAGTDEFDVGYDNSDDWADTDNGFLLIQQSAPQNASKNFFKGPFRLAAGIAGDTATPPTSPETVTSLFSLTAGQKLILRVVACNADGRTSPPQILSALAT